MDLIADIFLIFGALAATIYCVVLSRRLRKFTDLEKGVGGAIAVLSVQVDDMTKTLGTAQESATQSVQSLSQLTTRAEGAARRLELLVASLHDLPDGKPETGPVAPPARKVATQEYTDTAVANGHEPDTRAPGIAAAPAPQEDPEPLFLSRRNQVTEAAE